jgi:hypothetical protein
MLIYSILSATMGLFLWGRLRHDAVALAAPLASVIAGLVPTDTPFRDLATPQ